MSDFKYFLTITSDSREDIDHALTRLEEEGIIPNTLMVVSVDQSRNRDGLYYASLDTEGLLPYGTSKGWDAQEHEMFFHNLSLHLPAATFEFSGICIDDPQNGMFLKAFQNGFYKEVWQDNSDLTERAPSIPWRLYGEPEQNPELNALRNIYVLVCTHETRFGVDVYTSVHPTQATALAHMKNVKKECDYDEHEAGEYFDYNVNEYTLDINKLTPARSQEKASLSNVLANVQTRAAADQEQEGSPRNGKETPSL